MKSGSQKDKKRRVNVAGPKPFEMSKKKPEPDDRPRPISRGGVATHQRRMKKLQGIAI